MTDPVKAEVKSIYIKFQKLRPIMVIGNGMIFNLSRRYLLKSGQGDSAVWIKPLVLFIIGFYGGYIQIGIGLLLLAFRRLDG